MSKVLNNPEDRLSTNLEETYQALRDNLKDSTGFNLLFVRCSYAEVERLITRIQEDITDKKFECLKLEYSIDSLYEIVEQLQNQNKIEILLVTGIEKSFVEDIKLELGSQEDYHKEDTVPPLISHLNLQREQFRDRLNICLVLLLPRFALRYFIGRASDFFELHSEVFEFPTDQDQVEQESSRIISEGDYQKYLTLTVQERQQKILEIQELIAEEYQAAENKADLWFEIGNIYVAAREYDQAIAAYDQTLELDPDNDQAWYNRGLAVGNLER